MFSLCCGHHPLSYFIMSSLFSLHVDFQSCPYFNLHLFSFMFKLCFSSKMFECLFWLVLKWLHSFSLAIDVFFGLVLKWLLSFLLFMSFSCWWCSSGSSLLCDSCLFVVGDAQVAPLLCAIHVFLLLVCAEVTFFLHALFFVFCVGGQVATVLWAFKKIKN